MTRAKKGDLINKHFQNNIWHASAKGKTTNLPAKPDSRQQRLYEQTFWVKQKRARAAQPVPEEPVSTSTSESDSTSSSSSSSDDYAPTASNQYGWIFTSVKEFLYSEYKETYSNNNDSNSSDEDKSFEGTPIRSHQHLRSEQNPAGFQLLDDYLRGSPALMRLIEHERKLHASCNYDSESEESSSSLSM